MSPMPAGSEPITEVWVWVVNDPQQHVAGGA